MRQRQRGRVFLTAEDEPGIYRSYRWQAQHFVRNRPGHVVEVEKPGLLGHLRVKYDLQQEVAQFIAQTPEILTGDRIRNLVGFFDRVRRDTREVLLEVPGTAGFGIAQAGHDFE